MGRNLEGSHGHRVLDRRVRVVAGDFKILELVLEDGGRFAPDDQLGQRAGFALELLPDAFNLVQIYVAIAAGPDEVAGFQIALLGDEVRQ